jgi:hypothetical protein
MAEPAPKPPLDPEAYSTIAAEAFSGWARERGAGSCGCTYTFAVTGPTEGMLLQWQDDAHGDPPPWQREGTQPTAIAGPAAVDRVTYSREGVVKVTDLDLVALTIEVHCTGADPCPRGEVITKTIALEAGHREWPCKQAFSANLPLVASMQLPPADMVPEAAYLIPPIPPRP